jgi:SPP1 family predicted phage head-tail adaptor
MRTGPLNKRVQIQRRVETQNELKEVVISYVYWDEVWAEIEPLNGREFFAAQQISGDVSTKIRIRALDGVTRKMRVIYERRAGSPTESDYYEIDTVIRIRENNRDVYLMCRKVDTEGFRVDGTNG